MLLTSMSILMRVIRWKGSSRKEMKGSRWHWGSSWRRLMTVANCSLVFLQVCRKSDYIASALVFLQVTLICWQSKQFLVLGKSLLTWVDWRSFPGRSGCGHSRCRWRSCAGRDSGGCCICLGKRSPWKCALWGLSGTCSKRFHETSADKSSSCIRNPFLFCISRGVTSHLSLTSRTFRMLEKRVFLSLMMTVSVSSRFSMKCSVRT